MGERDEGKEGGGREGQKERGRQGRKEGRGGSEVERGRDAGGARLRLMEEEINGWRKVESEEGIRKGSLKGGFKRGREGRGKDERGPEKKGGR